MIEVQKIVEQILIENDIELVEFSLKQTGSKSSIRILVDTVVGKINLDQIAIITSKINNNEDFNDQFSGDFRLEVSSPGLSYPLKSFKDFKRNIEEVIVVKFKEHEINQSLSGRLIAVNEKEITISGKFGEKVISLIDIDHGKIEIKFK